MGLAQKKLPSSTAGRSQWIEPGNRRLSIPEQCHPVGMPSSTYHASADESDEKLALTRLIDDRHPPR